MAIGLIFHSSKGQRLNPPTLGDVEIGVLIPTDDVKKEVANETVRFWRNLAGCE